MRMRVKKISLFSCRNGLTMIEMMVGLTLFALTGAGIYTLYSQGIRIQRAAEESGVLVGQVRWAFDILTRDLENAVRWNRPGTDKDFFKWEKDEIIFLTATANGLRRIRYSLKQPETIRIHQVIVNRDTSRPEKILIQSGGGRPAVFFVREELPWRDADGEEPDGGEEVLATQVVPGSLRFSFAKEEMPGKKTGVVWMTEWMSMSPPIGVRVEIALLNPDDKRPSLKWKKDIFIPSGSRNPQQAEP